MEDVDQGTDHRPLSTTTFTLTTVIDLITSQETQRGLFEFKSSPCKSIQWHLPIFASDRQV